MKQELQAFKDKLTELGIQTYESGVSLAVQHCPKCGRSKFKVLFRIVGIKSAPFFGRCQSGSCQQNYSSISYLVALGLDRGQALAAHGMNPDQILQDLSHENNNEDIEKIIISPYKTEEDLIIENDVSGFYNIESCLDSAVAKYALKRGYNSEFSNIIKADIKNDAIVFIVRDKDNSVLGYQRRYINPIDPKRKTKTSRGFSKTSKLLEFPNNSKKIVICEGPFTALSAWHFGYYGVCSFGSGISLEQLEYIQEINTHNEILVAIENDEAGLSFFKKISYFFYWKDINVLSIHGNCGDLNDVWMNNQTPIITENGNNNPAIPDLGIPDLGINF